MPAPSWLLLFRSPARCATSTEQPRPARQLLGFLDHLCAAPGSSRARLSRKGHERFHATRHVVLAVRVVDLEVQHVVVDQREEPFAAVQADAAEHAARAQSRHGDELVDDVCAVAVGD